METRVRTPLGLLGALVGGTPGLCVLSGRYFTRVITKNGVLAAVVCPGSFRGRQGEFYDEEARSGPLLPRRPMTEFEKPEAQGPEDERQQLNHLIDRPRTGLTR